MNPAALDATTLAALAAFPDRLAAYYAAVPAGYRHWAPASWEGVPSEPFTAIEQVCHVRDIETDGYHVRLRRTIEETHPVLASVDGERLARERAYGQADASEALEAFRSARAQTLSLLAHVRPADLSRTAEFEGYGPLTLRGLVHYLCSHDQQHLAGLQWLLGKIDAHAVAAGR